MKYICNSVSYATKKKHFDSFETDSAYFSPQSIDYKDYKMAHVWLKEGGFTQDIWAILEMAGLLLPPSFNPGWKIYN